MSRSVFIFTFGLFIFLPHTVHAQAERSDDESSACTQETDEFKQQTLTRCEPLSPEIEEQPGETIYRSRIVLSRVENQFYLLVYSVSDSWNFLDVDTAYAIIDGENYEFQFVDVDREVSNGEVTEQNALVLDDATLSTFASAESIRVKLGQAVLRLPAQELARHARALRTQ